MALEVGVLGMVSAGSGDGGRRSVRLSGRAVGGGVGGLPAGDTMPNQILGHTIIWLELFRNRDYGLVAELLIFHVTCRVRGWVVVVVSC